MAGIPVARVVAVIAKLQGGKTQIGSGYLLDGTHVLTALHCTLDKRTRTAAAELSVRRASNGATATVTVGEKSPELDVAVLALRRDQRWDAELPGGPVEFGQVDRGYSGKLEGCEALGYPLWQVSEVGGHWDIAELNGYIRATEGWETKKLLLRDPDLKGVGADAASESQWGGMSGAAVFYGGLLLGVIIEHHPRQGETSLQIRPIAAVAAKEDNATVRLRRALGITAPEDIRFVAPGADGKPQAGERPDAAFLASLPPRQAARHLRAMGHNDAAILLARAEEDAAVAVLQRLLTADAALAVSLLAEFGRGKAEKLIAAVTAGDQGREWLRRLPEADEAIANRAARSRWTSPGWLEYAESYQRVPRVPGSRRRPPRRSVPVYRRAYAGGWVYWSGESGGRALAGVILDHYVASGDCGGPFGIPVGEETRVTSAAGDRWVQRFSSGAIYRDGSSVIAAEAAVADYLDKARGGVGQFYPLGQQADAGESPYGTPGWRQRFQGPGSAPGETVYYLEKAHGVNGEIAGYYELRGEARSWLGYPTADATPYRGPVVTQDFEGGTVFAGLPGTEAVAVPVASMNLIREQNAQERLGLPVAAEERLGHGEDTRQFFENGVVTFINKKREVQVRSEDTDRHEKVANKTRSSPIKRSRI